MGEYRIVWDTLDETTRKVLIFFSLFVWITDFFPPGIRAVMQGQESREEGWEGSHYWDVTEP